MYDMNGELVMIIINDNDNTVASVYGGVIMTIVIARVHTVQVVNALCLDTVRGQRQFVIMWKIRKVFFTRMAKPIQINLCKMPPECTKSHIAFQKYYEVTPRTPGCAYIQGERRGKDGKGETSSLRTWLCQCNIVIFIAIVVVVVVT